MRSANNCLLQKDDVGRPKPSTRVLPSEGHCFGKANRPDAVGVKGRKLSILEKSYSYLGYSSYLRLADLLGAATC